MSSRLAIPWRVALQQSPPPFRQPHLACRKTEALATIRQRMVTCPFRNCLTLGVQSTTLSQGEQSTVQPLQLRRRVDRAGCPPVFAPAPSSPRSPPQSDPSRPACYPTNTSAP